MDKLRSLASERDLPHTPPYTPLPTARAQNYCLWLQERLAQSGCLDFEGACEVPVAPSFEPYGGQMFGALVCTDAGGTEVVLKAFSGQYHGRWMVPGWVPPVPDVDAYENTVELNDARIHLLGDQLARAAEEGKASDILRRLREERKKLTLESQRRVFALYSFACCDGGRKSFADMEGQAFPSGTGDCCAPKLLHHAFVNHLHPVSLAEFYFGAPNRSGTKVHGRFYPPCDERCRPLLKHLLGLDLLYCDDHVAVVNKPSGLLSVPGRGDDKQDCVEARLRRLFPDCIRQPAAHRLDMDTSGLLLLAFDADTHRALSLQFMNGTVFKQYVALVDGVVKEREGTIQLPFRLDVDHRPRQIYDELHGKLGVTRWERLGVETLVSGRTVSRLLFTPLTGRTHQLRVHCAHEKGLGRPILGDRLYGTEEPGQRLALHACALSFTHPATGARVAFHCAADF
jgi:tRNA pseudouridine32 synthase/23S rRNA pseudouridine746 synthase